jgi:hypothetical protein
MLNVLANVDPADIIAFARAVPTPDDYLLTREIVPNTEINNVKYRIRRTSRYGGVAQFRAYDAETPFGRREVDHSITEGMLPPVGQKLFVGELETILLAIERGADDQELVDALYDDTEANVRAIRARMELAAGDLLTDRKFELVDENNLTLEADFGVGVEAGFSPTAPVLWTDPTADILDDELAWIAFLRDNGDGAPGEVLTSSSVIGLWARNHQVIGEFYGTDAAGGAARPTLTPAQVNAVRAGRNLPPLRAYDTQVRVAGVNVRVLPENRLFLLPANKRDFAETQYGITAEAIMLSRQGNPRIEREDQPGIVATVREHDDPPQVFSRATAVAMPVMYAPRSYIAAQVTA